MDKASLKEIYDNRDLIAQIFDLKAKFDNLPNHEELVAYKQMYDKFLSMYNENIMYTDKVCTVSVQHVYEIAPRRNLHLDFDNLGDNSFVHKRALREKVDEEINALSLKTLQLGNEDLQIVRGPVKFIGDVTLEKGNFAWLDKQNTFSLLQTFSQGITSNGASKFNETTDFVGQATFKDIKVANSLTLPENSFISGDKAKFTNLSVSTYPIADFNGIYDQYNLVVNQKMVVGDTTLPDNATFKVKGNAIIDGSLSATGSFKFGRILETNFIKANADTSSITNFNMIIMGGSDNYIKTLHLVGGAKVKGETSVITDFDEILMSNSNSIIKTCTLLANVMYTMDGDNTYEVINTNTHYTFDNVRPALKGDRVGDPQSRNFVTLEDVQKITPTIDPKTQVMTFKSPCDFSEGCIFLKDVMFYQQAGFGGKTTFGSNPSVGEDSNNNINLVDNNLITFGQVKETFSKAFNNYEYTWKVEVKG